MKKVIEISKKYWGVVLVLLFAVGLWIYKVVKTKPTSDTDASDKILTKEGMTFTQAARMELTNLTIQIAQNLGTSYAWFDPRRWSENDEATFKLIVPLSQKEFDLVAKLYFGVYAKGRDLRVDLATLLDSKYYEQLSIK
ncbi:structural protein [Cellulophaga phage Omtje_3]|uniref:Structural protein n=1 Tax=Cellulophaga phage Omtje_1 TaxID=2745694 RepID=A0A8E4ZF57_9VIRU|nr:structural protein [Cellulophaga phage Omtje_1]QQV90357.1 structural protein [Cellulophaga phage Omtje_2]QQV90370.1 structural protein [Cellulophaga phage Omtje_3]QQV90383.1 structural protein [Cellulophaga phage Omtje_4]QQV90396.1 structural protein [Cellulophaga phage Omtje_5]